MADVQFPRHDTPPPTPQIPDNTKGIPAIKVDDSNILNNSPSNTNNIDLNDVTATTTTTATTSTTNDYSLHFLFILIVVALIVQGIIYKWKQINYRSFQLFTLFLLWSVPLAISVANGWMRFSLVWVITSAVTTMVSLRALKNPMEARTPRVVYKYFKAYSNITFCMVASGYLLMLTGVMLSIPSSWLYELCLHVIFYGLYYGVLGRDVIDVLSDRMAASIGYHRQEGIPLVALAANVCAVCGGSVADGMAEGTVSVLNCGHSFHYSCIRGWSIIGKKEMCPYCKERIDTEQFRENPWQQQEYFYGKFLDFVRYLIVWQPVMILSLWILRRYVISK